MMGLWSEHFAADTTAPLDISPTDQTPPRHQYQRCLPCPKCTATLRLRTANTPQNPGRLFYTCPAHNHKFFKWADEVNPDQLIDVPNCEGCSAGPCRVRRETTGPNAGRILFMCRVKEGEGSCGYRVWQDELEMSKTGQEDGRISSFQSTISFDDINTTNIDLVEDGKNVDTVTPMINTSEHPQCREMISPKMGQSKWQKDKPNESSRRPYFSSPLDSDFVMQDEVLANNIESTTKSRSRSHGGVKSYSKPLSNLKKCCNTLDYNPVVQEKMVVNSPCRQNAENFRAAIDAPTLSQTRIKNVISKSFSHVFCEAAQYLQNEFLTLLETMDVKDHVAMREAAEATFAALDHLRFGDQDFKNHVNEFIQCASLLSEIEQSMPTSDSYQRLVKRCSSERTKLEETIRVHAETIDSVTRKKKCLKDLQEEFSLTGDWQIEVEICCSEAEMKNMEHDLEQLSRNKEELEGKYLIAFNELEELKKLFEWKKAEFFAAKTVYDRARALLRGPS